MEGKQKQGRNLRIDTILAILAVGMFFASHHIRYRSA